MRTQLPIALIAAVSATALLAACKDQNSGVLPPPTGAPIASMGLDQDAPPPPAYAPPAERLAPARPIRVSAAGPDPGRYLYVDDAYDMIDAFGDSPPDYAFDYDGVEPWVWRSDAGYYRVVEFVPDGLREYYYEPGYDEPFLIRDPRYSYGYDRGVLVTVYDSYGRALPRDLVVRQADYAGRYYARAEQLHYAALHQQRRAAYARQWQTRQDSLAEARQRWAIQRDRDNEWRQLRDRRGDVQRTAWAPEQRQRADYAARFAAEQKSQPQRGFLQAFRDNRERDRPRQDQQARVQADRAQVLAQQDRQRQGFRGDPREEAQRRQAEAQAQRMNDGLRRQEQAQAQALAQQQAGRQAERMARQDQRQDQRQSERLAEAQRRGADRAQADQARLAQARAADQHAAQASAREQMRAQAEGQRRNAEAQQRQAQQQAEQRQRGQAQRAQMEQQRAQASEQRRARAEQQRGQERQAQRAQAEQQQRAQAMEQRRAQAEQQRGQERQAQRAQMEQQRGQAMQQQRAQAEQQRAQAQQQRAEAANAQRQARDASAHERQAAQAQAAQAQKQHGNDKHDRPH